MPEFFVRLSAPYSTGILNMPYPTPREFGEILLAQPLDDVVRQHVFDGVPYAFRKKPVSMQRLRDHLCGKMNVDADNIVVVGSAKIGFSLSPDNYPREFSYYSDIDVAVVSEPLFDEVWHTMLRWNYPRRFSLDGTDWAWSKNRRNELYWGWFRPDAIRFEGLSYPEVLKPIRNLSTTWFNAFQSLSLIRDFSSRKIGGRLYRTWEHALRYHSDGLEQLKQIMEKGGI
jgi:hypothetical protein